MSDNQDDGVETFSFTAPARIWSFRIGIGGYDGVFRGIETLLDSADGTMTPFVETEGQQ